MEGKLDRNATALEWRKARTERRHVRAYTHAQRLLVA